MTNSPTWRSNSWIRAPQGTSTEARIVSSRTWRVYLDGYNQKKQTICKQFTDSLHELYTSPVGDPEYFLCPTHGAIAFFTFLFLSLKFTTVSLFVIIHYAIYIADPNSRTHVMYEPNGKWPCSQWIIVAKWIFDRGPQCPPSVREVMGSGFPGWGRDFRDGFAIFGILGMGSGFPSGTQTFPFFHARDMLIIKSFTFSFPILRFTIFLFWNVLSFES